MVLGVYAHGVPNGEDWLDTFAAPPVVEAHAKMEIVKSFGGLMVGKCTWAPEGAVGAMVIHTFKSMDAKRSFDLFFDPTAGMFKEMVEAGSARPPFRTGTIGPVWKF